jgi:hypothetical protein
MESKKKVFLLDKHGLMAIMKIYKSTMMILMNNPKPVMMPSLPSLKLQLLGM